jgi:SSS family transporter
MAADRGDDEPPSAPQVLRWEPLPPLPSPHGFAGSFCGVSNGALIVAGGANFPGGRPWDGAVKVWHDAIFVLPHVQPVESAEGAVAWKGAWQTGFQLPRPLAYGVSVTVDNAVVCLGGGDADRHCADVFTLEWLRDGRDQQGRIEITPLPPMPQPAAFFCGAAIGKTIYVAGGQNWPKPYTPSGMRMQFPVTMKNFWALDLLKQGSSLAWRQLPPWPGESRMLAVAGVQDGRFFLFGGCRLEADDRGDNRRVYLNDCYSFDPKTQTWERLADMPRCAAAAPSPALALGQSHLALVGGDDGELFSRIDELRERHPGFAGDILLYHTITDTWVRHGTFPKDIEAGVWPPVTTNTSVWHGRYVLPSGETRPGVRTPNVFWGEPVPRPHSLRLWDYAVLFVYFAAMVAIGFYLSPRENSTDDFFLGGHRVPWWAAGLSIFGTQLSAITFMAIPGKAYHTDWAYFLGNMMIVAAAPVVVYLYLPFFRRLNVTTAYEYLEQRFNAPTRLLASAAFVLFQLGRMGIVLYLPAAALAAVTGMPVYLGILLMGVLATIYTVMGGIEAVIWTDVVQVFVLLGGALLALILIVARVDGGLPAILAEANAAGKLNAANSTWDIATTALWVVLLGKPFEVLISYTADQAVVQRYLTTTDEKTAARGIWTNAVLTIPSSIVFFGIGTALWAFYRAHPDALDPVGKIDEIFPWFIANELPVGVSGLVIAGLFAAAMSTLDSSMNSMATALTTDFYRRLNPHAAEHRCLALAQWLTLVLGVVGTACGLYMAWLGSTSMWDQYTKIIGLFGGGLAGLFAVGIFTRRATGPGALCGFLGSALLLFFVTKHTQVHFFLYPFLGTASCFLIAYLIGFAVPLGKRDLDGLTIFTLRRTPHAPPYSSRSA